MGFLYQGRVTKAPGGTVCVERVRMAQGNTFVKTQRLRSASRKGLDPALCNARASRIIDGDCLCSAHAGQRALRILEQQNRDG